jgi:hypothetical protein
MEEEKEPIAEELSPIDQEKEPMEPMEQETTSIEEDKESIEEEKKLLHINIYIAIFNYFEKGIRYELTEKILKYYKQIAEKYKDTIKLTFIIQGSEGQFSKDLALQYVDEDSYLEYPQDNIYVGHRSFFVMFNNKIRIGFRDSIEIHHADIHLWAGSNDYISMNFFEQLAENYKEDVPQLYGIDNYKIGKNIQCMFKYTKAKLDILNAKTNVFFFNGESNYNHRGQYKFQGGIIGINKKCYTKYPDIIQNWGFDEGAVEKYILGKKDVEKMDSKDILFLNPKVDSKNDITEFNTLYTLSKHCNIDLDDLTDEQKARIEEEYENFMNL